LRSSIQDKIDTLSRHGQGQPNNEQIDEVVHEMKGAFQLDNEVMTFTALPNVGLDRAKKDQKKAKIRLARCHARAIVSGPLGRSWQGRPRDLLVVLPIVFLSTKRRWTLTNASITLLLILCRHS
jgi:hypothetical protein